MDASPSISIPLRIDDNGAIRIGKTRVLLELVIGAFQRGDTPEEIVEDYSALALQDVYAVIAYYLTNRDEVEAYLRKVKEDGAQIRAELASHETPETKVWRTQLRERLEKSQRSS